jgi:hypothetical protein
MMNGNNNQQGPPFTLEEIGERFGRLLGQAFAVEITLNKQIATLQAEVEKLTAENEALHGRVYEMTIEEAKEKAAD